MQLRLQKYSLDVEYKPGPQMYISDTLSRASLPATATTREDKATIFEILELTEKFELEDHHFVSDHRLARIKEETSQDTTLLALIEITKKKKVGQLTKTTVHSISGNTCHIVMN